MTAPDRPSALDIDLMRDVYMSRAQRAAYERILAIALTPRPADAGWRPIAEAPEDGTFVVATGHNYGDPKMDRHFAIASYFNGEWGEESEWNGRSILTYLTHWRPLPEPPAAPAPTAEEGDSDYEIRLATEYAATFRSLP